MTGSTTFSSNPCIKMFILGHAKKHVSFLMLLCLIKSFFTSEEVEEVDIERERKTGIIE